MPLSVIDIVILFTIMQLAAFGLFCAARGLSRKKDVVFLGLAFLSLALNIGGAFVVRQGAFFHRAFVHAFFVGEPFAYLYTPFFYLYVRRILKPKSLPLPAAAVQFVPFAAFFGYLCAAFYFHGAPAKRALLLANAVLSPSSAAVLTVGLQVQIFVYIALGVRLLSDYRRRLKTGFSSIKKNNASWISRLLVGLIPLWLIDVFRFIGGFFDPALKQAIETVLYSVFILFCYYVLFNAMRQPRAVFASAADGERPVRKNLSERTIGEYSARLAAVMAERKPHLNPELTLAELAEASGIPARSLSEVIRSGGPDNFYDFINDHRVREFLDLAARPDMRGWTVLDLLFEAGFNSKSVFNKAFKKKTGANPRAFLRRRTAGG